MRATQNDFDIESHFGVGSVINRTFSALFQKPFLFFGLAVLASIPVSYLEELAPDSIVLLAITVFLELFLDMVVQGAIAYAVFLALRGEEESLGNILNRGLGQTGPLLLVSLMGGLGILLGLVLLVIPGIILMCVLAVAAQACVVERLGAVDSLNRSAELTEGYRWPILGLYVVTIITFFIISFVIETVLGLLLPADSGLTARLGSAISDVIVTAFNSVMCGVIYFDLRMVKEGLTLDSLADIFD